MQGSLSLSQRLSLQSLAALQSYRNNGLRPRPVGSFCFRKRRALESDKLGANHDLFMWETMTPKGLAFVRNTGNSNMSRACFASTPSCSYRTEVASGFNPKTAATSGKSCGFVQRSSSGIPKPVHRHTALQWLSLHTQGEYGRKAVVRVVGKTGGHEVFTNEEFELKRIVPESKFLATSYSSEIESSGEDEEDEIMLKADNKYGEDSDSESDSDEGKQKDGMKAKRIKSRQKTENKDEMTELGNYEDTDSDSDGAHEKILTKKGERDGKFGNFDCTNRIEEEDMFTQEETKVAERELKQINKIKRERLKALEKQERKQKEAKGLDCKEKQEDESESDSEKEGEQNSKEKIKALSNMEVDTDEASDSEYEEEDDGVTDVDDDYVENENFVISGDEIEQYVEEVGISNEFEEELDDIDEEDDLWDDDESDVAIGDGGTGGGVVFGGTTWGPKARDVAEQVVSECGIDLSIFAFKISSDRVIRVRLDKLSDRYGSPTLMDIENFSRKFSSALESGKAGSLPLDIEVEVSSPGAERVVRVPDDLERFKELPMYVQYLDGETDQDGVFTLDSVDKDAGLSVWKIADVKLNREVKGKGRPLNSKQKKWSATVPLGSLKQVRLYLDV